MTNKGQLSNKITLIESDAILTEDDKVAETLNSFFSEAPGSLDIIENRYILNKTEGLNNPIDIALKIFEHHPSILKIKNVIKSNFSFHTVTIDDIVHEIKGLNTSKASAHSSIPVKNFKHNWDISSPALHPIINNAISECTFPSKLKYADIAPLHKNDDVTNKKNYRPISMLPVVSKVFERILHKQIGYFINEKLFAYMCGYRKGYNTQYALMALLERWKKSLDSQGYAGTVIMDLSKAFDTINYELLIAKLHAYGFDKSALNMINSYLTNRWHRTRINTSYSTWLELISGVPQGSILGPLLFNIYLNDLFFILDETEICNYADDTGLHVCDKDLGEVIRRLEHDARLAIEWFESNYMKLNSSKCKVLIAGHRFEHLWLDLGNNKIWESTNAKMLGIRIDNSLKFDKHITELCRNASRKLTALARLSRILPFHKMKILIASFFGSQFSYCPLIWMFHNRKSNEKINKLHERSLRILYNDDTSSFYDLLKKDKSVSMHVRNLRVLAIEMYKVKNNISPNFIVDLFPKSEIVYNFRNCREFIRPKVNTVLWGIESLRYYGPVIWDIIPNEIKAATTVDAFKQNIKNWEALDCPCRLCKDFYPFLGYI